MNTTPMVDQLCPYETEDPLLPLWKAWEEIKAPNSLAALYGENKTSQQEPLWTWPNVGVVLSLKDKGMLG